MQNHIRSSWNSDKFAVVELNKPVKIRVEEPKSEVKVSNAREIYGRENGVTALAAYKSREHQIDLLMAGKKYRTDLIVGWRAENLRLLKAGCELPNFTLSRFLSLTPCEAPAEAESVTGLAA